MMMRRFEVLEYTPGSQPAIGNTTASNSVPIFVS